jgi:UDP-N-acetylglucosamine:LPS N-acetylglucosamine transferase
VRYEDRMPLALAAADLVVCRSGGTTVAELAVIGVPSVLVPLPIATRDHQTANAGPLVRAGAAVLVPDDELDAQRLVAEVDALVDAGPERLAAMAEAARAIGRPDAAAAVADRVEGAAASRGVPR